MPGTASEAKESKKTTALPISGYGVEKRAKNTACMVTQNMMSPIRTNKYSDLTKNDCTVVRYIRWTFIGELVPIVSLVNRIMRQISQPIGRKMIRNMISVPILQSL